MELIEKILLEAEKQHVLFCDMDGCLCDFAKGYLELTGVQLPPNVNIPVDWEKIDEHPNFWGSLEWMPDGKHLWRYISKYKPHILSAYSKSSTAVAQKNHWVKTHLHDYSDILLVQREDKKKFAAGHHILIDDYHENVDEWSSNGGIGILHTTAEETIGQLKQLGL